MVWMFSTHLALIKNGLQSKIYFEKVHDSDLSAEQKTSYIKAQNPYQPRTVMKSTTVQSVEFIEKIVGEKAFNSYMCLCIWVLFMYAFNRMKIILCKHKQTRGLHKNIFVDNFSWRKCQCNQIGLQMVCVSDGMCIYVMLNGWPVCSPSTAMQST